MKITDHGEDRLDERVGLSRTASERLVRKVLDLGLKREETSGPLRRYLNRRKMNNVIVYGEHIYLFDREILVTVLHLPNNLKKIVRKLMKRKNENQD